MAPFDLDCPEDQLRFERLHKTAWGVSGCGKRTKYVRTCQQVTYGTVGLFHKNKCRWVQN